jgi:calpain
LKQGLHDRDAYTITKIHKLNDGENTIPLIRLKNPHGNSVEWTGPWSDGSQLWIQIPDWMKEELDLVFENDGEFYMNFNQHFLKYFGVIKVVHINPTNIECSLRDWAKTFDVFHMFGKWEDETSEGAVGASLGRNK